VTVTDAARGVPRMSNDAGSIKPRLGTGPLVMPATLPGTPPAPPAPVQEVTNQPPAPGRTQSRLSVDDVFGCGATCHSHSGGVSVEFYSGDGNQNSGNQYAPPTSQPSSSGGTIEVYMGGGQYKRSDDPTPPDNSRNDDGSLKVYLGGGQYQSNNGPAQPDNSRNDDGSLKVYVGGGQYQELPKPTPSPTPTPQGEQQPTPTPTPTPDPGLVKAGGGDTPPDRQGMIDAIRNQLSPAARSAFDQLGAKLDDKDLKTGKTLLENLYDVAKNGVDNLLLGHGVTKSAVLNDLVSEIADPGLIHQGDHGTCAATTLQYMVAKQHPSEFARLVGGLMNGGNVSMAGGSQLSRDYSSLDQDSGDRNEIDRIFQTAEMQQSELGSYDNRSDVHSDGLQGLTQNDVTNLANQLTAGRDGQFQTRYGNDNGIISRIQQDTAAGREIPVGLKWSQNGRDAQHELLVTKIENGMVYLRNPWGKDENGNPNNGPSRQLQDGEGDIVMPLSEFQQNLLMSSVS